MKRQPSTTPHFSEQFQKHESQRLLAPILRIFGLSKLGLALEIVQQTFATAAGTLWFQFSASLPERLRNLAEQKSLEVARQTGIPLQFSQEVPLALESGDTLESIFDKIFSEAETAKNYTAMMFACCHPALPMQARLALLLKTNYTFSEKDIQQLRHSGDLALFDELPAAKDLILEHNIEVNVPIDQDFSERMECVQQTLWALFSQGYEHSEKTIFVRRAMCDLAFRLTFSLTENSLTRRQSQSLTLMSAMCFLAARFDPRRGRASSFLFLEEKNRSKWNQELIDRGVSLFEAAGEPDETSEFCLLAQILLEHTLAPHPRFTNWNRILSLHYKLIKVNPAAPTYHLQLAWVLAKYNVPSDALHYLYSMPGFTSSLMGNWLTNALMGDFYRQTKSLKEAINFYRVAQNKAPTPALRRLLSRKILAIESGKGKKKRRKKW